MAESDNALMLRVAREEIKRQAAEIEWLQHWQRAVDDACTVSWVAVTDDARETVNALIARECQIALDPLVSSDAQALVDRGRRDAEAEIERLKTRLEVSPDHPYDGIASRDATIKLQDERIAAMRELVNVRLLQRMALALEVCDSKWRETDSMLRIDLAKSITAAEFQQAEPSSPSDNAASELEADAASPDA